MLIRTFCELTVNPQFQHSVYLTALYRTRVLGEWCGAVVPNSPYYSDEFFNILKHYHENSDLNIATMTIGQWTRVLTEDRVTHSPATPTHSETSHH